MRLREVSEGDGWRLAVERPSAAHRVDLLQPPCEQHVGRRLVGRSNLLARCNERFPAPADVGIVA